MKHRRELPSVRPEQHMQQNQTQQRNKKHQQQQHQHHQQNQQHQEQQSNKQQQQQQSQKQQQQQHNNIKQQPTLSFPTTYHVKGILQLPYGEIEEPFEAWYAQEEKMSRIDYYGGNEHNDRNS